MGRVPPWSDLPEELLSIIAEFLQLNPMDILTFRTVCKSWCSSSLSLFSPVFNLSPPLPLSTPCPPFSLRNHFSVSNWDTSLLSVTVVYALRPPIDDDFPPWMSRAWLLFLDQSTPGKVSIRQPFSQSSYSLPINFPRHLNLLDFHAVEMGRFYNLSCFRKRDGITKPYVWSGLVSKVVSLSSVNGLSVVVALADEGKLVLLRLGLDTQTQWVMVHDGKGFRFDDILEFKGRVLGIDRRGRVYEIEIGYFSPVIMRPFVPPIAGGGGRRKRLVESLGRLYLVVRCNVRGDTDALFKVYELNEDAKKWVEVNSLGGRTFFLGIDFSFSASAEKLHGFRGKNCILFGKRSFLNYSGFDDDSALFHKLGADDLHIGVWHLENAAHLGVIGSDPGYSSVLWPPPSWIWPKDKSGRVGNLLTVLDHLQTRIPDDKMETKFKELSLPQREGALAIMRQVLKMKELLNRVKEINKTLIDIELMAVSLQQYSKSIQLHNQVGTSTSGTEEGRVSVDALQKAIKQRSCEFDWFSMEINLNACILQFEENTSDLEDALKSCNFFAIV